MDINASNFSPIQNYFDGSTIFVTGATGFLGSLLVEKLLRTCKSLKRIYILIRIKNGMSEKKRFEQYFKTPVFNKLKNNHPDVLQKVLMMPGDCSAPFLGLSEENISIIISEVNCIFYCAAMVNFREKFRVSFNNNVRPVEDLLEIGKKMKKLNAIVYVSTAFTNSNVLKHFDETFHDDIFPSNKKLHILLEALDDKFLEQHKSELISSCDNIYVITKSVAEAVIKNNANGIPIAVVKPSVVMPTMSEPIAGWIDNYYGVVGLFVVSATGLIKSILCSKATIGDLVPADYTVNCILAVAWETSQNNKYINKKTLIIHNEAQENIVTKVGDNEHSTVKVYNCVSSPTNPITFEKSLRLLLNHHRNYPINSQLAYNKSLVLTSNYFMYFVLNRFISFAYAYFLDFIFICIQQPARSVSTYRKHIKFLQCYENYLLDSFTFSNKNTQTLWKRLSKNDQLTYNFDMSNIDWNLYYETCVKGIRTYLFRESNETLRETTEHQEVFKKMHFALLGLVGFIVTLLIAVMLI